MKNPVLVTGGAGYVGSCLVRRLLTEGRSVTVLDNFSFGGESLVALRTDPRLRILHGDIRDRDMVRRALKDAGTVVHLAAIVGDPACAKQPELAEAVNWTASAGLLEETLRRRNVSRFVFASTCSNYGKMKGDGFVSEGSELTPVSLYARLKVRFETALLEAPRRKGLSVTALRFATACGVSPRMRFDLTVNEFCRDMALGRPLEIFGKQFWRPYCHVDDLAAACALVLRAPAAKVHGQVFGVGDTRENYQKETIVERLRRRCPDAPVSFVHKNEDPRDYRVDFAKIRRTLGFKVSRRLDATIDEIVDGVRQRLWPDPYSPRHANVHPG